MSIFVDGTLTPPADAGSLDGIPADLQPAGAGQNGYVVTYVNATGDLELQPGGGGMTNPMNAVGNLIVGGAVVGGIATPARLAAGSAGYILRVVGGTPAWRELSAAGLGGDRPNPVATREGQTYWSTDAAAGLELAVCTHQGSGVYAWVTVPYNVTATGVALVQAADAAAARLAIGATATGGESWARPSPVTAGLGATFASARDSILYLSNGTAYSSGNEQSGWSVMLPTRPGADRAGLSMPSGYCYAGGLDLSTYTTDTTTLVGLFRYTGAPPSISTLVGVMDASLTGTTGYSVYLNLNGANVDLVAYCASTATLTTLIAAVNPSVGLHAIAIAPVLVSGNYRLRVSWDGGAVVDVAAAAGSFAAPTSTSQLLFFSRSDGYQIVGAGIDLLLYKTLLSSAAMAAITAPANVAGYLLDESAGGLNAVAATHRVLAQRYDPAFATTLYARGVIGASMTLSSVSKVVY
jgi:hypothetical protein